jgi:hypothetical protein
MTRKDWINVGISSILVDAIDSFLKSDDAKKIGMTSRQQFVNSMLIEFFTKYKQATGISHIKPSTVPSILDLTDIGSKKTKK